MDPGGVQTPSYRNIAENEKEGIQARWSPFEPLLHVKIHHFDNVTFSLSQVSHFCHKCRKCRIFLCVCRIANEAMETLDASYRTCWKKKPHHLIDETKSFAMRIGHLNNFLESQRSPTHM
jgi:hypothetical protein